MWHEARSWHGKSYVINLRKPKNLWSAESCGQHNMTTEEYILPSCWASWLLNGDSSGLEECDKKKCDSWAEKHPVLSAVAVGESYYCVRNDADTLAGDVAEYTFILCREATQKLTHARSVTTWQSPRGLTLDICTTCEARIEREGLRWPKDDSGQEYCEVNFGLHYGSCEMEGAR